MTLETTDHLPPTEPLPPSTGPTGPLPLPSTTHTVPPTHSHIQDLRLLPTNVLKVPGHR